MDAKRLWSNTNVHVLFSVRNAPGMQENLLASRSVELDRPLPAQLLLHLGGKLGERERLG
jgi:hypothetical protein